MVSGCAVFVACMACALAAPSGPGAAPGDTRPGLTVGPGGVLLKDGRQYRGVGINYFSAFLRTLERGDDTSYREGFRELAGRGIPFVRFAAGGFWPSQWKLYEEDETEYFRRLDAVVRAAEEAGLGLVPSLFWWTACVPDLVGEPRSQWGNPESKTIAFMRRYVKAVVTRYAASPSLWAWELGNEFSLEADLPNAAEHRPWVNVKLGTPDARSAADDLTHDMIVTAAREFARAVREHDPYRAITTGHSLPRPAAQHLRTEGRWDPDSREEFACNLIDVTPDPMNLVSVHVYPFDKQGRFGQETTSYAEILRPCMAAAAKTGRALFVGEFGASDTDKDGGPARAREENLAMLEAILETGVPLAALWNYDLPDQESFINVTPTNHRSYLLEELARANRRLRSDEQKDAKLGQ